MDAPYCLMTPYLIPKGIDKVQNLGDGFILNGIERRLGVFPKDRVFTTRKAPSAAAVETLKAHGKIIVGGANMLSDRFAPWRGFDLGLFDAGVKIFPFGIGLNGIPARNRGFTDKARAILERIHATVPYSSWRCPRTVALLQESFPHLKDQFLMTGCPVLYDTPILTGTAFPDQADSVAVSITERGAFFEREYLTLLDVTRHFPDARKVLVLHQDFRDRGSTWQKLLRGRVDEEVGRIAVLHGLARDMGFEIVSPGSQEACRAFYRDIDLHVGSRLHAHLHFLSQNKKTFLTYVDDRCAGFSEFYGFPLITPGDLEKDLGFDFEITRRAIKESFTTMQTFVESIHAA